MHLQINLSTMENKHNFVEGFDRLRFISGDEFVDLVIYKLYCYYIPDYHPKSRLSITEDMIHLSNNLNNTTDLKDFLEYYIDGKSIEELTLVGDLLFKAYKPQKKGANGNMDNVISNMIRIVYEKVGILKHLKQKKAENTVEKAKLDVKIILNQSQENSPESIKTSSGEKNIILPKGIIDFETWNMIFLNYINGLNKLSHLKYFRAPKKIKDFSNSLLEENRGNKTVFLDPTEFIKNFKFIDFYIYLKNYLQDGSNKKVLAKGIIENLPKLQIEGQIKTFTDLQNDIFELAGNLVTEEII